MTQATRARGAFRALRDAAVSLPPLRTPLRRAGVINAAVAAAAVITGSVPAVLLLVGIMTAAVVVHEFSHLVVARLLGIRATAFGVGFGPILVSRQAFGMRWGIHAYFLGGFVSLAGETVTPDGVPEAGSYAAAPAWRKIAVLVAGPLSNVATGFAILAVGLFAFVAGATPESALRGAGDIVVLAVTSTFGAIASIPTTVLSVDSSQMSSLVGLTAATSAELAKPTYGTGMFVSLLAGLLSLSLGLFNLLPVAPLDGGGVVRAAARGILGARWSKTADRRFALAGIAAVFGLFAAVLAVDIIRITAGFYA
jgi:membrane-associated protease RseP (regulator of RpoE activity)